MPTLADFGGAIDSGVSAKKQTLSDFRNSTPQETPKTTFSGVTGAITRGLAPVAAGAAVGAAAGTPFAGVGAIPGAVAGGAAVGLTELATAVYDALAPHMSAPKVATPQEATDKVLDWFNVKRPSTPAEHMTEDVAGMLPFGAGSAKGAEDLVKMISENRANAAENYIKKAYTQVIKPSTTGSESVAQRRSAISDIVQNKAALKYTDESGKLLSNGHLPETVEQATQAIDQTKAKLVQEWTDLATKAGDKGAMVPTESLVKELRQRANDPGLLRDDPAAAKFASDLADRYAEAGAITPIEAQEAVSRWNQKLKPYYNNPGFESPAGEVVARNLRAALDHTITSAEGPGYQSLKHRYGALAAIEEDVDRASRRIANREPGGGISGRLFDTAAVTEAAAGLGGALFTHDVNTLVPALSAAALTKGVGAYVKWLREPNRVIKEMFKEAEKYHKPPQPRLPVGNSAAENASFTLGLQ